MDVMALLKLQKVEMLNASLDKAFMTPKWTKDTALQIQRLKQQREELWKTFQPIRRVK